MEQTKNDISRLSVEELRKELERREAEAKEARLIARERYERERNALVTDLMADAVWLENKMKVFKSGALARLNGFRQLALEYGEIRSNSKGGFLLRHSETQEVVSLDRNTVPEYDERASLAEQLLKEFLEEKVKKRDKQTYRTISALMERNKKGDYTPSRIASLLKIRDNYDDEKWVKAMQLFEESFQVRDISYSVSFYRKDTMGKDQALCLTFASLPVDSVDEEAEQE
ncbi:MAG: DUF3164 family protein [Bacteroidales bacterium]|jgi:hypothetical protein|nr:DUF3164 family protein [Bacteroidales bacterium]